MKTKIGKMKIWKTKMKMITRMKMKKKKNQKKLKKEIIQKVKE